MVTIYNKLFIKGQAATFPIGSVAFTSSSRGLLSLSASQMKISFNNGTTWQAPTNDAVQIGDSTGRELLLTLTASEMNYDRIILKSHYDPRSLPTSDAAHNFVIDIWTTSESSSGLTAQQVWEHDARTLTSANGLGLATEAKQNIAQTTINNIDNTLNSANTELTVCPTTISSMKDKISALFQYFFNKRSTTVGEMSLYKDDDATILGTSTISDNGTVVTKGKIS